MNRIRRGVAAVLCGAIVSLLGCSAGELNRPRSPELSPTAGVVEIGNSVRTANDRGQSRSVQTVSQGRALRIHRRQKRAGPKYAFWSRPDSKSVPSADNPGERFHVQASRNALTIRSGSKRTDGKPRDLRLRFAAVGRGAAMRPLSATPRRSVRGNRVEYAYPDGIEIWYLNGPLGVEQGFELARRIGKGREGRLVLEMSVEGGLKLERRADGSIAFVDPEGETRFRYGTLYAEDARGHPVAATIEPNKRGIALKVDDRGARYPLTVDPVIERPRQKLTAPDPRRAGKFGSGLGLGAETLVIGAEGENIGGIEDAGAAYAYKRSGSCWIPRQKLVAREPKSNNYFGDSVAVDGDRLAIGGNWINQGNDWNSGAVFLYVRDAAGWCRERRFHDPEARHFGSKVALDGRTLVVGAHKGESEGAFYIFERRSGTWERVRKVHAPESLRGKRFGTDVAVDGDRILVGADSMWREGGTRESGRAFLYRRDAGQWSMERTFAPEGLGEEAGFGMSVALHGGIAVVGAPIRSSERDGKGGEAYIFERTDRTWKKTGKLISPNSGGDEFGWSVDVHGERIVVGAWQKRGTGGKERGSAYLYEKTRENWTRSKSFLVPDLGEDPRFGYDVAIHDGSIMVGASRAIIDGTNEAGAAFEFGEGERRRCRDVSEQGSIPIAESCDSAEGGEGSDSVGWTDTGGEKTGGCGCEQRAGVLGGGRLLPVVFVWVLFGGVCRAATVARF